MGVRQKEGFTDTKRGSKLESLTSDLISAPSTDFSSFGIFKNQTSFNATLPTTTPDQKCTWAILLDAIDFKMSQF